MSRIDDLVSKYCPNGVERWLLGDLEDQKIIQLGRGDVISKTDLRDNPGEYPVYSSSATGNGILGFYSNYMFEDERLSWSIDGGGKFFYRPQHKYSITNVCGWLKVLQKDKISTKYLFYVLTNEWVKKVFDYTNKAHPSVIRKEYTLPIPPLPVQEEIVKILDSFTMLEAELEKELETRKQQYEYYRNKLLNPENMRTKIQTLKLSDICSFSNGKGHEKFIVDNGKFIVVNSKFVSTEGKVKKFSNNQISPVFVDDILMVMSDLPNGKALAKCFFVDQDDTYTLNQRICQLTVKNKRMVLPKYLYYVLNRTPLLLKYDNGCDQTNLRKEDITSIDVDIPALEEQERIVSILDKFGVFINDMSEGLPAEIEARKQQYEYYRNKLLDFQPIAE